jgi:hypothetical protein
MTIGDIQQLSPIRIGRQLLKGVAFNDRNANGRFAGALFGSLQHFAFVGNRSR